MITLSARTRLLVDDRLLPTGQATVAGTDYDFSSPAKPGAPPGE